MPADRTSNVKRYPCDFVNCGKSFARSYDLGRHKPLHGDGERKFQCPFETCTFSAHQKGNLRTHVRSQHEKVRLPCSRAGCDMSFKDSSALSRHKKVCQPFGEKRETDVSRSIPAPTNDVPIAVDQCVKKCIEENSPGNAAEILLQFSAFTLESLGTPSQSAPPTNLPSSLPSSSSDVSDGPSAPPPHQPFPTSLPWSTSEHPSDVQTGQNNVTKTKHRAAFNANNWKPPSSLSPATFESVYDHSIIQENTIQRAPDFACSVILAKGEWMGLSPETRISTQIYMHLIGVVLRLIYIVDADHTLLYSFNDPHSLYDSLP